MAEFNKVQIVQLRELLSLSIDKKLEGILVSNREIINMVGTVDGCMKVLEGSLLSFKDIMKDVSILKKEMKGVHMEAAAQQVGQVYLRNALDHIDDRLKQITKNDQSLP
ncbi:hypothetical protein CHUAL_000037 [Chamberlinius hualienensis]